jgi:DNA-binding transcriptional MocR family regulator
VFIVSGSQQGLYLLAEIFLNPGDVVIVESPTYVGALSVFRARGARIVGIPGDEKGLRVDVLENLLWRQVPRLIYILPTFQNPRGVVLSPERRKEILELAYRFRVPIIEDDPYSHLYFKNPPPASLKSQDKYDQVIYLSTFSKIIFPGLRVGWINAPRPVVERLSQVKQFLDLHSPTLGQRALYEFCRRGLLEGHLEKSREIYARKKDIMLKALHRFCSPWLTSTDPEGGFYLWGELPPGWDSKELLREAVDEKVVFVGGETFFPEGEGQNYLRLNFSFQPEELLIEGSRRLGRALTKLAERNKDHQERRKLNSKPIV